MILFDDLTLVKSYMRIDADDDDDLIREIIEPAAEFKVMSIAGYDLDTFIARAPKLPVLYATAYLYEHREEADHQELDETLRALLAQERTVPL